MSLHALFVLICIASYILLQVSTLKCLLGLRIDTIVTTKNPLKHKSYTNNNGVEQLFLVSLNVIPKIISADVWIMTCTHSNGGRINLLGWKMILQ